MPWRVKASVSAYLVYALKMANSTQPTRSCSPVPMATVAPLWAKMTELEVTPASTAHAKTRSSASCGWGLRAGDGQAVLGGGDRRDEVRGGTDAVHEGLLEDDAAVGHALDVKERNAREFAEAGEGGQLEDTEVFACGEFFEHALFGSRGRRPLQNSWRR